MKCFSVALKFTPAFVVQHSGKKNSIDKTDLRHMLKRKAADVSVDRRSSTGKGGSGSGGGSGGGGVSSGGGGGGGGGGSSGERERDNKRRRKERDDNPPRQIVTGKGRQADSKRKKQSGNYCFV